MIDISSEKFKSIISSVIQIIVATLPLVVFILTISINRGERIAALETFTSSIELIPERVVKVETRLDLLDDRVGKLIDIVLTDYQKQKAKG